MTDTLPGYRGLLVSTWDLGRGDTSGWSDRAFFRDIIEQYGMPALDVGCSTGRLVLDFQQQGMDVDGVDASPEMVAICRDKADALNVSPHLYVQRMEALDLPRRYRTIVVPSSSLQLVTNPDDALRAVRCFYAHLEPGGALVTPFSFAWREGGPLSGDWQQVFELPRPEDGAIIRRWSREWHEPEQQLWHCEDRFEVVRNGVVTEVENHVQSPEGRWYTQAQAMQLFRDGGFADVRAYHGFTQTPAREDDTLFCVLGIRA